MKRSVGIDEISANIRSNKFGHWGKGRTSDEPGTEPGHASRRLGEKRLELRIRPKRDYAPNPSIFAMGSCFAREIERGLLTRGFDVPSAPPAIRADLEFISRSGDVRHGIVNRYNTPSMELEFRNLLGDASVIGDDEFIVKLREGEYFDAHYHNIGDPLPTPDGLIQRRDRFRSAFQGIRSADIIVITLGLAEACFDLQAQKYRNMSPSVTEIRRKAPLEVHFIDYEQNLAGLEAIRALIGATCKPGVRIVLSVSPVPLTMTYFDEDVIVANSAAKAMLRAAAAEFVRRHDNVDYFPSYELVTLSERGASFSGDRRHVQKTFVAYIVETFVQSFGLTTDAPAEVDEALQLAGECR